MSEQQQQQKEEIEKILKEIAFTYRAIMGGSFYYKLKGEKLKDVVAEESKDFIRVFNITFNPNFEYGLYLRVPDTIIPSQYCSPFNTYHFGIALRDAVSQFIPDGHFVLGAVLEIYNYVKDPLEQILAYRGMLSGSWLRHTYFCSPVYFIRPWAPPDPASIFPQRYGVVAYCTTLANAILLKQRYGAKYISDQFNDIYNRALEKLRSNRELYEIFKQDYKKACDINLIKSVIHDEIEEANKLMEKYGIIRVAFPLS